jgi:ABC-type ATPase involved in cell division
MPPASSSTADAVPLLRFEQVSKSYPDGRQWVAVFEKVSFEVHDGEHVGIFGSRRAGKSTLLRLAAGIEAPDDGRIVFEGRDIAKLPALQHDRLLRDRIGLLASEGWRPAKGERVVDHVALPLVSDGATMHEARRRARQTLHWAGATKYADELAVSLAVGERMRVMLARALVRKPRLLLVDEPAAVPSPSDAVATRETDLLMEIGGGELLQAGGESGVVVPLVPRHAPRQPGGMERSGS